MGIPYLEDFVGFMWIRRVSTGFVPLHDLGLNIPEANKDTQVRSPPDLRFLVQPA